MKNIYANTNSETLTTAKVVLFTLWIAYIILAITNNIVIEAFLFSIAVVIISYFIFGRNSKLPSEHKRLRHQKPSSNNLNSNGYLSVFFYNEI